MTSALSPNTQAILLLTAPLIAARTDAPSELLTPGEYKRFARHLHQLGREPADLLTSQADEIVRDSSTVVEGDRIKRLLARGFALSQSIDRWQTRAIWVVSRADPDYPQRLRDRLKDDRPAVLYGCGERSILDSGGLAVVGSRDVDETLVEYTQSIGRLVAKARKTLVSGGARGIDQAAMRGALEAGGTVSGVLADSLEKTALNRDHRSMLMEGQLVLLSPYDPGAGFNVGNAMQRNKIIYALADAALVVNSDLNKGGTWAGAVEQLDKLKFVPVFVRSTGAPGKGLEGLSRKGALPWPNPDSADDLDAVFGVGVMALEQTSPQDQLFVAETDRPAYSDSPKSVSEPEVDSEQTEPLSAANIVTMESPVDLKSTDDVRITDSAPREVDAALSYADELFAVVRKAIPKILETPKKDSEVAAELLVTTAQAKEWLQQLIAEGAVENVPKKKTMYQLPGRLI